MRFLFVLFFILILLFERCSPDIKKSHFVLKEKKIFQLNYTPNVLASGSFYQPDSVRYFYFSNITTSKILEFYNESGKRIRTINLKKLLNVVPEIMAISIKSFDTIYCISKYSGIIALIDGKGDVLNVVDLNTRMNRNEMYEYMPSKNQPFYQNGYLYFQITNSDLSNPNLSGDELIEYQNDLIYKSPYLIRFKNVFDKNKCEYKKFLNAYYSGFLDKSTIAGENPDFFISENKCYVASWYNDSITVLDMVKNQKISKRLYCKYSAIKSPGLNVKDMKTKELSWFLRESGMIDRIWVLKNKKIILINYIHHTPDNKDASKYRKQSVAAYDMNLNKIFEVKIDLQNSYLTVEDNKMVINRLIKSENDFLNIKFIKEYYEIKK